MASSDINCSEARINSIFGARFQETSKQKRKVTKMTHFIKLRRFFNNISSLDYSNLNWTEQLVICSYGLLRELRTYMQLPTCTVTTFISAAFQTMPVDVQSHIMRVTVEFNRRHIPDCSVAYFTRVQ